jgi:hypothetical protein
VTSPLRTVWKTRLVTRILTIGVIAAASAAAGESLSKK